MESKSPSERKQDQPNATRYNLANEYCICLSTCRHCGQLPLKLTSQIDDITYRLVAACLCGNQLRSDTLGPTFPPLCVLCNKKTY